MTPLEAGQAKIAAGNFHLTPEEATALAVASAAKNPVMVPVEHGPSIKAPATSPWNDALIDQIIDITEEFPRDKARQALTILFTEKNVRVSIEKTWDSEDAFSTIKTGS